MYEERHLRFHNEKKDKLDEFNKQTDRLTKELEFMRSEDKDVAKTRTVEALKQMTSDLKKLETEEKKELQVCTVQGGSMCTSC